MKRNISLFVLCLVIIGLSSCSGKYVRGNSFGLMYEEKPVTVLLFPPINQTEVPGVEHDLWEAFYMAMCEKGYYAFSPALCLTRGVLSDTFAGVHSFVVNPGISKYSPKVLDTSFK